jgi:NhaP-type Na+/H+ or K+/H+ antiporter
MHKETKQTLTRLGLLLGALFLILYAGEMLELKKYRNYKSARLFSGKETVQNEATETNSRILAAQVELESDDGVAKVDRTSSNLKKQIGTKATDIMLKNENSPPEGEEWKEPDPDGRPGGEEPGENKGHKKEEAEPGEALIVYIVAIILVVGGFCREIKKATNIPYTPQLLVFGILLGTYAHRLGDIGHAFWILLQINPHGILMIFIPTIIFESAYNSDPFTIKRQIWQILLLAGPGVVVGALIITIGFNYALGYSSELSVAGGLTFGAIVCATDPVAVVALLKELGTPLKFNVLLEGESLLNDGTAMVFYIVFSSIYKAQGVTLLGITIKFLQLSLGGVLLGAVACYIAIMWLRRIVKDEILTIAITFMACYVTFFVGETYLGVSGILAIVSLGVLMSMFGKVRINPESEHSVHIVWSFIQYVLETVIFVLTGGYIGYYTIYSGESTITSSDWVKMVLFYFIMTLARYLMIWIFTPLMNKTGYPIVHKDIIVLTYGGLRGAIALCLGLMVYTDEDYSPRFRDLVLFYLTGMITMTVLFNGLTMKWVMEKIQFTPENRLRTKVKNTLTKSLVITAVKHQQKIKNNKFLTLVNWETVNELAGTNSLIKSQLKNSPERELVDVALGRNQGITADENMVEIRYRIYRLIKSQFWLKFEESFCSSSVVTVLNESVDFCMDSLEEPVWIYECISENIIPTEKLQSLISWRNTILVGRIARSFLNTYMLQTYEMLSTLIISLEELLENKPNLPLSQSYVNMIFGEVAENKNKAEQHLFMLSDTFPELISSVQNKQAAHMILNSQKESLNEDFHNGILNDEEFGELIDGVNKRISSLDYRGLSWEASDFNDFSIVAPMFHNLRPAELQILKEGHTKMNFTPGTVIFKKGQPINGVYIIMKGLAEDHLNQDYKSRYGLGSVLHWGNIITPDCTAKSTLTAIKDVTAYFISKQKIEQVFELNPEVEDAIYKSTLNFLIKVFPPVNIQMDFGEEHILHIQKNSTLISKKTGEMISLEYGGFFVSGEMKLVEEDSGKGLVVYNTPQLIGPQGARNFKVVKPVKILRFGATIMDFDDDQVEIKKSFLGQNRPNIQSGRNSGDVIRGSMRNSIMMMVSKEKDVDKIFEEVVKTKFRGLTN